MQKEILPFGWERLNKSEDRASYKALMHGLSFNEGRGPAGWRSITEPDNSETYLFKDRFEEDVLERDYLNFFRSVTKKDEYIFAYDPYHPSYKFQPHLCRDDDPEEWPIPAFPNGDYGAFFSANLKNCIFGFPWEAPTACVIGSRYIEAIKNNRPTGFGKQIRKGGKEIRQ